MLGPAALRRAAEREKGERETTGYEPFERERERTSMLGPAALHPPAKIFKIGLLKIGLLIQNWTLEVRRAFCGAPIDDSCWQTV